MVNSTKKIEGYLVSNQITTLDRTVRTVAGVTGGLATSILAAYAGSQAAAHDPETSNLIWAIGERMSFGVTQTIADVSQVINVLRENPSILSDLNGDTISRETIDMGTKLYEYIENSATSAAGSFIREPLQTLIASFGLATVIKFLGKLAMNTFILRDKPDLEQRIRNRTVNLFRSKDRSRKIEIGDKGGNTFTRL